MSRDNKEKKYFFVMYFADLSACGPFDSYKQCKQDSRSPDAVRIVQVLDDDSCKIVRSWRLKR